MPQELTEQEQIMQLNRRFEDHLIEHQKEKKEYLARQLDHEQAYARNMEAIAALTKATTGVVEAWTTLNSLQRFLVWVSKFGILAGVAAYIYNSLPIK